MQSNPFATLEELSQHPPEDARLRKDLYNAAMKLVYNLESAQDTAQRLYHGHIPLALAQTGNDMSLFQTLAADTTKRWTIADLTTKADADPVLLHRLLACLAAYGMVKQNKDGSFSSSNICQNLAMPSAHVGIKHYSLTMTPAYNAIPKFLANTKYRNPCGLAPFNTAYKTDLPVFEWRKQNPENAQAGQAFMAAQRVGQNSVWDNKVPLTDFHLSASDLNAGRILLVDVGGGYGHQMIDLRKLRPEIKGKMITQDLSFVHSMRPNVDELLALDIEPAAHDFMQPQPIRGAKVYYLRNVLHNWNDANCIVILKQIRDAMVEDSVVIVDDVLMPKVGATWKQTSMDIAMMTMLAAMERTEEQFGQLFRDAGLELRNVWEYDEEYGDSFIVATPVLRAAVNGSNGI